MSSPFQVGDEVTYIGRTNGTSRNDMTVGKVYEVMHLSGTYISIIKSQLSQYELRLLFYYAISNAADASLKALIEKYSLFDRLIVERLIHIDNKRYYNVSAYSSSLEIPEAREFSFLP